MASVDLEAVSKLFADGTHGLDDCTLHVDDGELLVVVGPSGCGKSTLLRIIAGLETPTHGTLRIGGRVVNQQTPQQRNVAMVFQDYALYPFMTVRQNLEFPLRMRRLSGAAIAQQVQRTAGLLDLVALLDRFPKQLSGGQRQRVAMGRALVREPSVSLLDEPLSNLDAKLRVQVRAEIAELQERTRTTMIYVTHDQVEAMTLGHRVAVLDRGRLQQVSTPQALYDHPANVFVAGFIGSPPMNLFEANLQPGVPPRLLVGTQCLTVDLSRCSGATPKAGGERVTAGIRPEALKLTGGGAAGAIRARILHVEYLGHETLAHVQVGDNLQWIARLDGMLDLSKEQIIHLYVDPQRIHLFGSTPLPQAPKPPTQGSLPAVP
jgi:ABC-type sugar transport system ATPase subunit